MKRYIWAFPGLGKSSLAISGLSVDDADSERFKFAGVDFDSLHGSAEDASLVRDEAYPLNYLGYIQASGADMVLLNCHISLLEQLNRDDVLLVYPDMSLIPEYLQRYKDRGDHPSFVSYMEDEAVGIIRYIENSDFQKYRVKEPNIYLRDLFERNDFKVKVMNRAELTEHLQKAKDLDILGVSEDGRGLLCGTQFLNDASVYGIAAEQLADDVFNGKYELDIDLLVQVCEKREAAIVKEKLLSERRGGLSREALADKIMQGIVNGALGIEYDQIAPYSHGYEVTFGGSGPIGSTRDFKNRWECYCGFFDVPAKIVDKIEEDRQNGRVFGKNVEPFDIHEMLQAIDDMESRQISGFTPEKETNFERWGARGYGSRGSVATVMDVHAGKGLDGIVQHHYHGDYASMTPSRQNSLVETLVFMKGFCLDCLGALDAGLQEQRKVIDYLRKHGTDISTPAKLREWVRQNPEKCGYQQNRDYYVPIERAKQVYEHAYCDFIKLKSLADSHSGSLESFSVANEIDGHWYEDVFECDFGVLYVKLFEDKDGSIAAADDGIDIWDPERDKFLAEGVCFEFVKRKCQELGLDLKELEVKALANISDNRASLDEQIATSAALKSNQEHGARDMDKER